MVLPIWERARDAETPRPASVPRPRTHCADRKRSCACYATATRNHYGTFRRVVCSQRDLSARREANMKLSVPDISTRSYLLALASVLMLPVPASYADTVLTAVLSAPL